MIGEHKTSYAGYLIQQWNDGPLNDPATTAYRMTLDYDERDTWLSKFARFVSQPQAAEVEALVIGAWWGDEWRVPSERVVESFVMYHERLPRLKALFIGDVTYEECEMSWIDQSDMAPIFLTYPNLEHFGVRGIDGLRFGGLRHDHLRSFTLESGGTPVRLLDEIKAAHLPQLVDFELWTGDEHYGWDGELEDLLPFINGEIFPHLTRLAIPNSELSDEVASALSESPLFEQLEAIDLSLGTLSDEGALALLNHPLMRLNLHGQQLLPLMPDALPSRLRLKSLDIHHHYCTPPVIRDLVALAKYGIQVDVSDVRDEEDYDEDRYVAVGE